MGLQSASISLKLGVGTSYSTMTSKITIMIRSVSLFLLSSTAVMDFFIAIMHNVWAKEIMENLDDNYREYHRK